MDKVKTEEGHQEQDSSQKKAPVGSFIRIKVVDQDGREMEFTIKTTSKLGKIKQAFCERMNIGVRTVRFYDYNHKRVLDDHTPAELELEDEAVIEVYSDQYSGSNGAV